MANRADKSAIGVNAIGKFSEGLLNGWKTQKELEQLAADRAIKQQAAKIEALNAAVNLEKASRETQVQETTMGPDGKPVVKNSSLPGLPAELVNQYRETLRPALGLPPLQPGIGVGQQQGKQNKGSDSQKARTLQNKGIVTLPDGSKKALNFNTASGQMEMGDLPEGAAAGSIAPTVAPTLPATEAATNSQMDVLGTTLKQMKDNYDSKFVGPVASRLGKAKQYTDVTADTQAGKFYGAVNDIRNQLIYLRSGKQINESEYGRLLATLPDESKSSKDFSAKLANFEQVFGAIKEGRANAFQNAGYRNQGLQGSAAAPAPAATVADHSARIMALLNKPTLTKAEADELRSYQGK